MSRKERRILRRKGKRLDGSDVPKVAQETHVDEGKEKAKRSDTLGKVFGFYDSQYKKILLFPILLFIIAIIVIAVNVATTGDFINKGVSLKGGISFTLITDSDISIDDFQNYLKSELSQGDIDVRRISSAGVSAGLIIEASDISEDDLLEAIESKIGSLDELEYSVEEMGSTLGESFFKETLIALCLAFVFMGLVVFFYFRSAIPSLAVILAALADMICTVAMVNILQIRISTAGIAAFLMLIGYSVDTDILLSTRLLKRQEGTILERAWGAMKTGLTMTTTTMIALLVVIIVTQSEVLAQIMVILLIGLVFDLINTWMLNLGILKWFMDKYPEKVKKLKKD